MSTEAVFGPKLEQGRVTLVLPPDASLVRVARLTASAVAAQAGLTIDLIETVKIAVSEAMSLFLGSDDTEPVTLHLDFGPGSLTVTALGSRARLDDNEIELAQLVLEAVSDEYEIGPTHVRVVLSAGDVSTSDEP